MTVGSANNKNGRRFENYVYQLYSDLGRSNMKINQRFPPRRRTKRNKIQVDVMYGSWPFQHYVECKYHRNDSIVTLRYVERFFEDLYLLKISSKKGEIITNTDFTRSVIEYAEDKNIKLYNYNDLIRMENQRRSILEKILRKEPNVRKNIKRTGLSRSFV